VLHFEIPTYYFGSLSQTFPCVLKPELAEDDLEDFKSCISNLSAENTELKVITNTRV
jgi:hypothetical protein